MSIEAIVPVLREGSTWWEANWPTLCIGSVIGTPIVALMGALVSRERQFRGAQKEAKINVITDILENSDINPDRIPKIIDAALNNSKNREIIYKKCLDFLAEKKGF